MYMYRYKLYQSDLVDCILEDDFPSPYEQNKPALKLTALRELNRKNIIHFQSDDKYNNVIDYHLEIFIYSVNKPAFTGGPVVTIPLYLIDSKFSEKPELNFNIA